MLKEVSNLAEFAQAKIILEKHEKAIEDLNKSMRVPKPQNSDNEPPVHENPFAC